MVHEHPQRHQITQTLISILAAPTYTCEQVVEEQRVQALQALQQHLLPQQRHVAARAQGVELLRQAVQSLEPLLDGSLLLTWNQGKGEGAQGDKGSRGYLWCALRSRS